MATSGSVHDLVDATPEDVGMSSARLRHVTALTQRYVDEGKFAGSVTLLARRDRVIYCGVQGMMDAESGTAMRSDAVFRIASMTKPIASVALMTLFEEGHFQLDTPISDFIAAFEEMRVFVDGTPDVYGTRPPTRPINVRDVLTHTAGFEPLAGTATPTPVAKLYERELPGLFDPTGSLAERVDQLAGLPLVADPGTRFTYHYATEVVGRLCEVISGHPLDRFLAERIFEPLGMSDTSQRVPVDKHPRLAANYALAADVSPAYHRMPPELDAPWGDDATFLSAAAGLTSTASDYLRFCRMLLRGGELDGERILGPRTLQYMTLNHFPGGADFARMGAAHFGNRDMAGTGFGLGFAVVLDTKRSTTLTSKGEYWWGGAFSTAFFVAPAEDLIAIFLTQLNPSSAYPIRDQLRATIYPAITD